MKTNSKNPLSKYFHAHESQTKQRSFILPKYCIRMKKFTTTHTRIIEKKEFEHFLPNSTKVQSRKKLFFKLQKIIKQLLSAKKTQVARSATQFAGAATRKQANERTISGVCRTEWESLVHLTARIWQVAKVRQGVAHAWKCGRRSSGSAREFRRRTGWEGTGRNEKWIHTHLLCIQLVPGRIKCLIGFFEPSQDCSISPFALSILYEFFLFCFFFKFFSKMYMLSSFCSSNTTLYLLVFPSLMENLFAHIFFSAQMKFLIVFNSVHLSFSNEQFQCFFCWLYI